MAEAQNDANLSAFIRLIIRFPADLVTFTEEIRNGKLHFLCSEISWIAYGSPFEFKVIQLFYT